MKERDYKNLEEEKSDYQDNQLFLNNPLSIQSTSKDILLKISEEKESLYSNPAITLRNIHKTYLIEEYHLPSIKESSSLSSVHQEVGRQQC